ncbi:hypothetical protein [uncultured Microbacterium sp.]|uniref:Uncharacterized protein n=1 Tax=uncultured Microbacterium sp. TaxID=191216 RepID=A0A1Y5P0R8_9MICO|nr:hypothetical protein [uncultured Microbacterium sp.]SBS70929.1 conserved exported hypothetical protein [uncultured Microbacterium sp.]
MNPRRFIVGSALGVAALLSMSACATSSPSAGSSDAPVGHSLGSLWPAPPEGEVVGQGTVMDVDGTAELCVGAVMESYPPQCDGIPLKGWSWDGVDGSEAEGDVRWGTYAVQGTYDGEVLTVTQPPIMLALYDPMMPEDPTGGKAGAGEEAELLEIQEALPDLLGAEYLSSYPENGWLWVDVVWDDGTWQKAADDDYGKGVVVVRSALRELAG